LSDAQCWIGNAASMAQDRRATGVMSLCCENFQQNACMSFLHNRMRTKHWPEKTSSEYDATP